MRGNAMSNSGQTPLSNRRRALIFVNIMLSCIAMTIMATALTTALPPIVADLGVTMQTGQWLTSGYSLAMGIVMPLTAFLITRFPTKPLYLAGTVLFIIGSLICVAPVPFAVIMVGRVVQACGNGLLMAMAQVVLMTIYPDSRGTIMGWYGLAVGVTPVIAPTLSGLMVDAFGWRSIFYLVVGVMAVSLIAACLVFDNVLRTSRRSFDVLSFAVSIVAFGGVTLGIGNIGSMPLTSMAVLPSLALGVAASVWFVMLQLKRERPFLDVRILRHCGFALSVVGSMLLYFAMMGSSVMLPLYVQTIKGGSASMAGLVSLPGSLAMAVISPMAGRLYDRFGVRRLFLVGGVCLTASNLCMGLLPMSASIWVAATINVARSLAIGCLMMPLVTWGTGVAGEGRLADANALLTALRTIAGAIGQAVFVGMMTALAASAHAGGMTMSAADMHGLNLTYLVMGACAVPLIVIPLVFLHSERNG
ncbi:DHA2 family efflux MFS transporter permease subunit [Bifidobacterium saguinibicoloris]|uniref:DHA2 family efflux MFS transporter permease subunit n=1 Tax=Bifidobacterium saguinibicoloris TaxID=2834433 RepID=UPI001C594B20|nr:DHA2 family efflux MFS transporter permease subunit [Bifidobacterium saguinibicoloris]MBW3081696.1 DHA2 family efflux MFS transporter permease subunit [Bifidobacterium saguinibicoloris]